MNRAFSADVWDFVIWALPQAAHETAPSVLDTPQFYVIA